ncbi:MAG: hypothetical protein NW215_05365 [Hyphomicrobiales bacterium]|nr:hypothetical protein [Hyphomicrobiales bacterium]
MFQRNFIATASERMASIRAWLSDAAPYTAVDQKHLDAGSPEQAYWHHGYQAAIADMLAMRVTRSRRRSSGGM